MRCYESVVVHMTKITFFDATGRQHDVYVSLGGTVMQVAKENEVPGILADCGGACACATCHVIVEKPWFDRIPAATDFELEMLEFAMNREANSRLSCQIKIEESLDGIVIRVPSDQ